jgi:hypothetical protein
VAFPVRFISNHKKVKFLEEFQKMINSILSLENILENSIDIEKLKKEFCSLKESSNSIDDIKYHEVNQGIQKRLVKNDQIHRNNILK